MALEFDISAGKVYDIGLSVGDYKVSCGDFAVEGDGPLGSIFIRMGSLILWGRDDPTL